MQRNQTAEIQIHLELNSLNYKNQKHLELNSLNYKNQKHLS